MEGNLALNLARRAETYGWRDRPLFHTDDRVYTHGQIHDAAERAAGVLYAAGVRLGHRVLIALPDSAGLVAALLGTLRLGALAVLAGPGQSADDHAHVLADAQPSLVVCGFELAGRFPGVRVLTPEDLTGEPAYRPPAARVPPGHAAYVQYTSGTTGRPKGAVHRHGDPPVYFQALALGALGLTPGDVVFSVSKAYGPYGLGNTIFFPMFCGGSAVLWPSPPTVDGVVEQARRHRPTVLLTMPALYARLVEEGDPSAFASLRVAATAGEPLLPALGDRIEEFLGCPLLDGLGTTEVGHTFVSNTIARSRRGTLGLVLGPYEIDVRHADGRQVAHGERGLLHVQGPSVLIEYLGHPDRTAEVLGRDGWLRTGDLVHVDEDGFVHHHGRAADLELVAGASVSPLEVERALGTHRAVAEVAVVGDGAGGLRAFVVLSGPYPPSAVLERELRALAPPGKVPHAVTFLTELPRTAAGKLRRIALRQA